MIQRIELLSPAGDWEALQSAVENGADAVYLGMKTLNARRGAGNFDDDALLRAAEYCHERGKKIYVTVNTVVKQLELPLVYETAESLLKAGVDAAIVQDLGVALALKEMLPSLELHASTQMAAHNRSAARFLKNNGFKRAVLARELTFEEIRECADEGIEVEVFTHGALCVSTSGQCLFSSLVGGRSGNRGMCAQPCRLPYKLSCNETIAQGHLLSPKDIMTVDYIDQMKLSGVASLKIEGRLKRPEYVAVVTGIYRRALDGDKITKDDKEALMQIFNRGGFTAGYAPGVVDSALISKSRPSHWGVSVGKTIGGKKIRLLKDVLNQDAVSIRTESGEDVPVRISGRAGEEIRNPVNAQGEVMRLVSETQMQAARETVRETKRTVALSAVIDIKLGENAKATITDGENETVVSGWLVEKSDKMKADPERICAQFSKTGGTPYYFTNISPHVDSEAFVPASGLNALRRDALEAIRDLRLRTRRGANGGIRPFEAPAIQCVKTERLRLIAQASRLDTLYQAKDAGADEIAFLPFDVTPDGLKSIRIKELFYLVLPPVLPDKALLEVNSWANGQGDALKGVYLSNIGQLALSWPGEVRYDYPMNIANAASVRFLNAQAHVYTPSVELTDKEIRAIGGRTEYIVYGRIPLMHLRHCPLNAALGGGIHSRCRRCDQNDTRDMLNKCVLTDRMRARFPLSRLKTESGCVIDIGNSVPLSLDKHFDKLSVSSGIRLLFTDEDEYMVQSVTSAYRALIDGCHTAGSEIRGLTGYTTGHYFKPVE